MNNNINNNLNVLLYCRVSTDEQSEGFSLNYQEEFLKRFCVGNGYNIVKIYRDDHSAKNFNRPEWKQLKSYAKANRKSVDKVLYTRWDRFSRNLEQALKEIREFDTLGIELNASEQYLDMSNCDNKMVLSVYLTAGEVERDKISSRTINGTYQAKCEGYYASRAPYGYDSFRDGSRTQRGVAKGKRSKLIPNENAHFVTRAFQTVALGIEPAEVVRKRLKKEGMTLEKSSFSLMLKNIVYAGKIEVPEFKKESAFVVDAVHEPLIDLDTFLKVQEVFKNKRWKGLKSNQKVYDFPLRQFLTCDICGETITGSYSRGRNERYGYYHCRGKCQTRVRKEKVETRIADLLTSIQINANIKDAFIDVMSDVVKKSNSHKAVELNKKKERRKQILEQLENADDMRLTNQLPADRYTSIVDRYSSELRRLELEIEALELNNENVNDYLETGLTLVENLDILFNETDNEGKKMLIGSLFTDKLILGNECCRTTNMNEVINVLTRNSKGLEGAKKGKAVKNDSLSVYVPGVGIEPTHLSTRV